MISGSSSRPHSQVQPANSLAHPERASHWGLACLAIASLLLLILTFRPTATANAAPCPAGQTADLMFTLDNRDANGNLLDPPGLLRLYCDFTVIRSWRVSSGDNNPAHDNQVGGPLPRGLWRVYRNTVRHPDTRCTNRSPSAPASDRRDWYPLQAIDYTGARLCFYIHGSRATDWKGSSQGCLAIQPGSYGDFKTTIDAYFPTSGTMTLDAYYGSLLASESPPGVLNPQSASETCFDCPDDSCVAPGGAVGGIGGTSSTSHVSTANARSDAIDLNEWMLSAGAVVAGITLVGATSLLVFGRRR